ncbi:MAG: 1,4-alpha-glucan branching protein GlgB [Verrucomicrobiae bacterium]|nr:1,4-alpha-glucan branching protein GlgB [Verrucomicrobiae bacterium]
MESAVSSPTASEPKEIESIFRADHSDPFSFLGMHPHADNNGVVLRVFRPDAVALEVFVAGDESGTSWTAAKVHAGGFFELVIPDREPFEYRLVWESDSGAKHGPFADPYSFWTVLGEEDLYYMGEGTHQRLWEKLGAHPNRYGEVEGMTFAVWAPNARRVSVIGDFNFWDGRIHSMRKRMANGIWEIFIPQIGEGQHYKFEIVGAHGNLFAKSDPFAFFSQHGVSTASITHRLDRYEWKDEAWMDRRREHDLYRAPVSIYEVHLGSWARIPEEGNRFLTYREFGDRLLDHVVEMGFTHIELMPVSEFPFDGSWGYQVCGYFSPTSRFGSPDEFREFVDRCHQRGIGVILDWVPAHFPKDPHGLGRFDGTALYEHADPKKGEHTDWGTLIFNYGRTEVRNFLIANALFWLEEYHIDGLRVDAVASMLYLDYSRKEGQWIPNQYGGRENLEAIEFIRMMNSTCYEAHPGIMMIAEESTAFPGVSRPVSDGGLGFGFKWNMGWMHDFLSYMAHEPVHRKYHHGEATFAMIYAYHENYMLVLSHDEVVHGKQSLLHKMPGDRWQQFANLRLFYSWMFAHPGKKLLFQGAEIAQGREWKHSESVDWHLLQYGEHAGIKRLVQDLNRLYSSEPAIHELDHWPEGFEWIDHLDSEHSLFSFIRRSRNGGEVVVVVNATPVVRRDYRLGVGTAGYYTEIFNSDAEVYGGTNVGNLGGVHSEPIESHWREHSLVLQIPPLATIMLRRD